MIIHYPKRARWHFYRQRRRWTNTFEVYRRNIYTDDTRCRKSNLSELSRKKYLKEVIHSFIHLNSSIIWGPRGGAWVSPFLNNLKWIFIKPSFCFPGTPSQGWRWCRYSCPRWGLLQTEPGISQSDWSEWWGIWMPGVGRNNPEEPYSGSIIGWKCVFWFSMTGPSWLTC